MLGQIPSLALRLRRQWLKRRRPSSSGMILRFPSSRISRSPNSGSKSMKGMGQLRLSMITLAKVMLSHKMKSSTFHVPWLSTRQFASDGTGPVSDGFTIVAGVSAFSSIAGQEH